jgi:ribosomal protein S18 acetylase RimI-like enzyme
MESEVPKRLSDAFPPSSSKNVEFVADVHSTLSEIKISSIDPNKIILRPIKNRQEMDEIRLLHKEWFPIDYSQEFFDLILKGKTKSLVAEIKVTKPNRVTQHIVIGCILYSFRHANSKYMSYSISDYLTQKLSIYILTIGVINEFRKMGIATKLLNEVIRLNAENNRLKYIYLHVISYNKSAQNFYKKNTFFLVKIKKNHYTIDEKNYDAFVYARYVNGANRPMDCVESIKYILKLCNIPSKIWMLAKGICKKLLHVGEKQPYKSLKV